MTTIAVTKTELAGDRQLTHASGLKFKSSSKLYTFENPIFYPKQFHVGLCGGIDICLEVLDFMKNPVENKLPKGYKNTEFIVLTADGKIFTFSDPRKWLPVHANHYAIGSGSHFALGAMAAGATPREAVIAAAKVDPMTGFGATSIQIV